MIFASLGSSPSASWLIWTVLISWAACIGGIIVFCGLWMEKNAGKKEFLDIGDFRWQKLKAKIGWWILMLGIAVEIVAALALTVRGELEMRQIKINEAKMDPLNQPISSVTATARLIVRGTNFWSLDPVKDNHFVTLSFAQAKSNFWAIRLLCKTSEKFGNSDSTDWNLEFGADPSGPLENLTANDLVKTADKWDIVVLQALFLRKNTEILNGGEVTVIINTTVKHFPIPPQLADPMYGPWPPLKGNTSSNRVNVMVQSGP